MMAKSRNRMPDIESIIDTYSKDALLLRASLQGLEDTQLDARPIAGKWSIREVVCHLADAEVIYAERMKRVLAEENPTFFEADPEQFRKALHFEKRSVVDELNVIEAIRKQMTPILRSLNEEDFERSGQHSLDGPMNLKVLLQRITNHIPHHLQFIEEKIAATKH